MDERRAALHCPVCRGLPMDRLSPEGQSDLVLDYCRRCGGMWFDSGEVALLRESRPQALLARIELRSNNFPVLCPGCRSAVPRNAARCPVCRTPNVIDCPVCSNQLVPVEQSGLRIDACRKCRGTWFDNVELDRIWNIRVVAYAAARGRHLPTVQRDRFLMEEVVAMDLGGELIFNGAVYGVGAIPSEGLGQGIAGLAEAAVDGTGDLAGSLFEGIAGIIGAIFDGF